MNQLTAYLAYIGPLLVIALKVGVVIGALGSAIEAVGLYFKLPRLVAFGKTLEAIGGDIPKVIKNVWAMLPAAVRNLIPNVPPLGVLFLLACFSAGACAAWQKAAKTVDQAAIILCDVFFAGQPQAVGLSPKDVEEAFCSTAEQVEPFLSSAKVAAQRGGAVRLQRGEK